MELGLQNPECRQDPKNLVANNTAKCIYEMQLVMHSGLNGKAARFGQTYAMPVSFSLGERFIGTRAVLEKRSGSHLVFQNSNLNNISCLHFHQPELYRLNTLQEVDRIGSSKLSLQKQASCFAGILLHANVGAAR